MNINFVSYKKIFLLFMFAFILLFLFINFFIPQYNNFNSTKLLLKNKELQLKNLKINHDNSDNNLLQLEKVQNNYINNKKLPILNDYYTATLETYNLINNNNLIEINTSILDNNEIDKEFISHNLHIKVIGNLPSIMNFIGDLNNLNYYNKIHFVNISNENSINKSNFELTLYIQFTGIKDKLTIF